MRRRPTCGRWRVVEGRRVVCTFNRGHRGDCKPVRELARAAEIRARGEEAARRFTWLLAHDATCEQCRRVAPARRARETDPDQRLRCPAALNVHLLLEPGPAENTGSLDDILEDE